MIRSRPRTRIRPSARARSYATLEAAAIAAARRNDALLLYVPDSRANVFSNADTSYVPTPIGGTIGRWMDCQYGVATMGPELVSNGTFDSGLAGWTQALGIVSWNAGVIRCERTSGQGGRATLPISCEIGATYRLSVDRSIAGGVSSAGVVVSITSGSTVGGILSDYGGSTSWSTLEKVFVATQTQHWIALDTGTGTTGQYAEYDNVSVQKIIEAPTSRGPELFTNNDFSSWSSDNPVGWNLTFTESATTYVTQDAQGARLVTTDGTYNELSQNVSVTGKAYEVIIRVTALTGTLVVLNVGNSPLTITTPGVYRALFTSIGASVGIKRGVGGAACDATIAWISCKEVLGYHGRQPGGTNKPALTRVPRLTGAEQIVNGEFDSPANWSTVSATISGGVLPLNAQFAYAQQDVSGLEVGASYVVSYDVISASGTSPLALSGSGFSGATQVLPTVVGYRNYYVTTCTNPANPFKVIAPNTGTTVTIDNISLRKVQEWSYGVSLDGSDDWMDVTFRDYFVSGAYTFISSWWGPVTGNSSFILCQSSSSSTNPLVSPLFIPSASINASIFERSDSMATGLSGTTYATGALRQASTVELVQTATPVGNFKGYLAGLLDRNTNYTRVVDSVTTNKVTFGASQRTSTSGFGKGIILLICISPNIMPEDDRRAIGDFATYLRGGSYV